MEHSYFKDRISAYFDNELKDEQRQLIAEHLKECAECRQMLADLRKFDELVEKHSGLGESEYWESAARKIDAAVAGPTAETEVVDVRKPAWQGLSWKLVGVAASFAILAFIALYERDISDEVAPFRETIKAPVPSPQQDSSAVTARKERKPREKKADHVTPVVHSLWAGEGAKEKKASTDTVPPAVGEEPVLLEEAQPPATEPEIKTELAEKAGDKLTVTADEYDYAPAEAETQVIPQAPAPAVPKVVQAPVGDLEVSQPAEVEIRDEDFLAVEGDPLPYWRHQRDSLLAVVDSASRVDQVGILVRSRAAATLKATEPEKTDTSVAAGEDRSVETKRLLLESQYMVALLTDDDDERDAAIDFLKGYLGDENASLRQAAVDYLALLPETE